MGVSGVDVRISSDTKVGVVEGVDSATTVGVVERVRSASGVVAGVGCCWGSSAFFPSFLGVFFLVAAGLSLVGASSTCVDMVTSL